MTLTSCLFVAAAVCIALAEANAQDIGNVIPFQGQLANQSGQPLSPTGPNTLVFRLYRQAVGGIAIWEESQPNISVSAGRFSVLLGSRTELPATTNFNATLYLGITLDDGNPATADVEMRPRQALVPVVSASYAKNADKLAGYDWSEIFGVNSPTGKIAGAKLADSSLTRAQIEPGTITSNQLASGSIGSNQLAAEAVTQFALASGAVGSQQIAIGAIGAPQIAVGGIQTSNLADGLLTLRKLAPRTVTNNAPVGGVAWSLPVVEQRLTGTVFENVSNLTITIQTTGRPVLAFVVPSLLNNYSNSPGTSAPSGLFFNVSPGTSIGFFRLVRDDGAGAVVTRFGSGAGGSAPVGYPNPMGPVFDLPREGMHTYTLQWGFTTSSPGVSATIYNSVLVVMEL